MEDFIQSILEKIVGSPKDIQITKQEDDYNISYLINVNQEDFGKVIGKKGKTINSLRNLANLYFFKNNAGSSKRVFLKVVENT